MIVVIQRVLNASVHIKNKKTASIDQGLLVLIGIAEEDTEDTINWMVQKIIHLRIFSDQGGKMNLSVKDIEGSILIVSQFTLHANTKKGNRPSFIEAAKPEKAIALYDKFISTIKQEGDIEIQTGIFGADMQVSLVNDGPVTLIIDSKNKK